MKLPAGVRASTAGSRLIIRHRWFNFGHLVLLVFGLGLGGIGVVALGRFLAGAPNVSIWPGLFFLALGLPTTIAMVNGLLNSTIVQLDERTLKCTHGPFPLHLEDAHDLSTSEIEDFVLHRHSSRSLQGGYSTYHSVHARKRDGRQLRLLGPFLHEAQAECLRQLLQSHDAAFRSVRK